MSFERILFVPGIKTWKIYFKGWEKDLEKFFPNIEKIFFYDFYLHFEHKKIEKIVEKGKKLLSDGKKTLIISHSFGGILAKTMINRCRKKAKIYKFITMASPHDMKIFGVNSAKKFLKTPLTVSVPTKTFGGFLDLVVPFFWSHCKNSQKKKNFWCGHLSFLFYRKIRKKVLLDELNISK